MTAPALKNSPTSIGDIIDQLDEVRAEKRELSKQVDALKVLENELKLRLIAALDEQGLKSAAGGKYRGTITETTLPQVDDWDAAWEYILENEATYLVARKMNAVAWRELQEAGETVPGTSTFVKRDISFTKI